MLAEATASVHYTTAYQQLSCIVQCILHLHTQPHLLVMRWCIRKAVWYLQFGVQATAVLTQHPPDPIKALPNKMVVRLPNGATLTY